MNRTLDAILHPKRPYSWLFAIILACVFGQLLKQIPDIGHIDTRILDSIFADRPAIQQKHPEIVVVGIGDEDLAPYTPYRMPIHRGLLAELIDRLSAAEAKAIGIDIMFVDPTIPELDDQLLNALNQAQPAVIIATGSKENGFSEAQLAYQEAFNRDFRTGPATLIPGVDGTIRLQAPRSPQFDGRLTFPGALAEAVGAEVPDGQMIIDFQRGRELGGFRFEVISALAALEAHPAFFVDKIVLIGATMPDDRDDHPTPLDLDNQETYGVLIQAEKLSQMLDGRRVVTLSPWQALVLTVLAAMAGVALAVLPVSMFIKLFAGVFGAVLYLFAVWWIGKEGGPALPFVSPALAIFFATIFGETFDGAQARRERKLIRQAFQQFISPSVVKELVDDPRKLELRGEEREISTIFTDLQGFTALTAELEPQMMVRLLNGYLDRMLNVVIDRGGLVDKVIGDAVHACFGAPTDQPTHAAMALECVLELNKVCEEYRAFVQTEHNITWGETRIGLHTGRAVVGNFGSSQRFDYTAHGDSVNTAARLEGANKTLRTRICVSRMTISQCPDAIVRRIGFLKVAGRSDYLETLQPIAEIDDYARRYEEAIDFLTNDNPESARAILEALLAERPQDGLVAFHLERIAKGERNMMIEIEKK